MEYKDTPNERILNLFTGLEGFLVNYLATNPKDKEEAAKYLGYIRKGIEEKYEDLPAPPEGKVKKVVEPVAVAAQVPIPNPWLQTWEQAQQAQAAGMQQGQQQVQGAAGIADWGTDFFWRR